MSTALKEKPRMNFWQIFSMSFGFLGIQFGFALQNGNASRILQNFGADVHELSWFWLVAPLTGMLVQPLVGYYSDRTWNRLGRRKPFFLVGTILSCLALIFLPNADIFLSIKSALLIGAGILMIMDASINVAMEPFRALVADNLRVDQNTFGFSIQTFLIGVGAVAGSYLPSILADYFGFSREGLNGGVAPNVIWSFYIGAMVFFGAILVTLIFAKEYPPEEYKSYHGDVKEDKKGLMNIFHDFKAMPSTMKQLGLVQFFSWFALFSMWVFTTPAVAHHIYGLAMDDTHSLAFNKAGDEVGKAFGMYNLVATVYALLLPFIAMKIGKQWTHAFSLIAGGIGLIGIYFCTSPDQLIYCMIGVGIAWASILAMPYALLAGSIPAGKMGIYMGIFNFFITLPQIVNGVFGGLVVKYAYNNNAIYALLFAGVFMILGAFTVLKVKSV
jgi:maltose/moltooligosaccharide transporter